MPQISGIHHVSLPATDVMRSTDWFERVFGFSCLLIKEEEDRIAMATMEHPAGVLLYLHQVPQEAAAASWLPGPASALALAVTDRPALMGWDSRLTDLGVEHGQPREAHLGWALDVIGPDGLRIQLHTREDLTSEGA